MTSNLQSPAIIQNEHTRKILGRVIFSAMMAVRFSVVALVVSYAVL